MALDCIGTPVGLLIMNRRYVCDVVVPGPDAQNFSSCAHPDTPAAHTDVHVALTRPVSNLLLMFEIPPDTRPRTRS